MSTLHRLKAYFGMVPVDEFDDYDDYGPDQYGRAQYSRDGYGGYAYDDDPEFDDEPRGRAAAAERSVPRRPSARRAAFDGYGDPEPAAARPRRSGFVADAPPVRGALAVDTAPPMRDPAREPGPRCSPFAEEDGHPLGRIVTLHPRTYNEARPIGERFREGTPVIMNLTEMDDADAKRLVDFAAGLAFALRGAIDKVTTKVFLLSPANVAVSAEDKRRIAEGGFFNQS